MDICEIVDGESFVYKPTGFFFFQFDFNVFYPKSIRNRDSHTHTHIHLTNQNKRKKKFQTIHWIGILLNKRRETNLTEIKIIY